MGSNPFVHLCVMSLSNDEGKPAARLDHELFTSLCRRLQCLVNNNIISCLWRCKSYRLCHFNPFNWSKEIQAFYWLAYIQTSLANTKFQLKGVAQWFVENKATETTVLLRFLSISISARYKLRSRKLYFQVLSYY